MLQRIIDRLLDKPDYRHLLEPERLGVKAEGLLNDLSYQQARENLVTRIVAEWIATKPDDVSRREQLHQQIQALSDVQTELALFAHNQKEEQDNAE